MFYYITSLIIDINVIYSFTKNKSKKLPRVFQLFQETFRNTSINITLELVPSISITNALLKYEVFMKALMLMLSINE